jgi:hypothetical protein
MKSNFNISTAALGTHHSIEARNGIAAVLLRELRRALVARQEPGKLAPLVVSGALVVEPADLDFAVDFLKKSLRRIASRARREMLFDLNGHHGRA